MNERNKRASEQIKQAINCFDLINAFNLDVRKDSDGSYRCKSFTHDGTNPTSLQIWEDSWYCHSSKMSGDVISMYGWLKFNGDNSKAFKELLYKYGDGTDEYKLEEINKYNESLERVQANVEQYHKNLTFEHRQYFHKRRVTDSFIDKYKCGYDPASDRLIIPIWKDGKVIYWCGRAYDDSKVNRVDYPKYKKPSLAFNTCFENDLYGYDTLDRKQATLWIAEGVFDYISLYQEGKSVLSNATGMSNHHIKLVTRIAKDFKQVAICYDNDKSGNGFCSKLSKALFESGIPFRIIRIPETLTVQNELGESVTKHLKDISDCYCIGLMPDTLLKNYSCDGVEMFMSKFDDYEELKEYLYPRVPYLPFKFKNSIFNAICENDQFTGCKADAKKWVFRERTQQEYAKDFINTYSYALWFYEKLGNIFEFKAGYWKKTTEMKLRKTFEEKTDVKNTEEKAIFEKVKIQSADDCDAMPNQKECFNVANGTLYFYPLNKDVPWAFKNDHDKEDYCTYIQDYDYNPNANDDIFMSIVSKIFKNHPQGEETMIKRYEEYLGAVFIQQNIEQKMIMFVGNGSNGKSVLNDIVQCMLGGSEKGLYSAMGVQMLQKEFMPANLNGKLVQFFHDPKSDTYEAEAIMKQIISNDEITSNVKNKEPITFKPRALCFCDSNEMFHPKDKTEGWTRRFIGTTHYLYNKFTQNKKEVDNERVFEADNKMQEKIRNHEFLSSVLNHALKGYERIVRNGLKYTEITPDAKVVRDLYGAGNNLFRYALEYDFHYNGILRETLTTEELYNAYVEWYTNKNYGKQFMNSKDTFSRRIEEEFLKADRKIEKIRLPQNGRVAYIRHPEDEPLKCDY